MYKKKQQDLTDHAIISSHSGHRLSFVPRVWFLLLFGAQPCGGTVAIQLRTEREREPSYSFSLFGKERETHKFSYSQK